MQHQKQRLRQLFIPRRKRGRTSLATATSLRHFWKWSGTVPVLQTVTVPTLELSSTYDTVFENRENGLGIVRSFARPILLFSKQIAFARTVEPLGFLIFENREFWTG